ncbi:ParB N-terminal domain-containing protein [Persicobacter diffluens]|uniref:ParB-like N-terminal domain-containing protein n=1 Tax=Persicobacter diffluens TaxID=981 RepID=A0AAN5ANE8_9BACT|nr:hypothetical protein PEDI_52890 [Persicobacter diffluens]
MAKKPLIRKNRNENTGAPQSKSVVSGVFDSKLVQKNLFVNPATLQVLPELKNFIAPLSDNEFDTLKTSVQAHGIYDPIKVWNVDGDKFVIDGHHRYRVAQELKLETVPVFEIENLDSREDVLEWMLTNQLGRRNITPLMASFLRGRKYAQEVESGSGNAIEKLTQQFAVSRKTLHNDRAIFIALEYIGKEKNDWYNFLIHPELPEEPEREYVLLSKLRKSDLTALSEELKEGEVNLLEWLDSFDTIPVFPKEPKATVAQKPSANFSKFEKLGKSFDSWNKQFQSNKFRAEYEQLAAEEKAAFKDKLQAQKELLEEYIKAL